jgi:hypothetical protein
MNDIRRIANTLDSALIQFIHRPDCVDVRQRSLVDAAGRFLSFRSCVRILKTVGIAVGINEFDRIKS